MAKDKNKRTLLDKLRYKYRLIVINEDTFEQKTSLRLSRINIYSIISAVLIVLTVLIVALIAFTPIKYYMPGVGSLDIRGKLTQLELSTDSLKKELDQRNQWIANFQGVLTGEIDSSYFHHENQGEVNIDSIDLTHVSDEEQDLRAEMEDVAFFESATNSLDQSEDKNLVLIAPIEGVVIESFSLVDAHVGIDIAGEKDATVKAVGEGTIVVADWNPETGHVIAIQHSNNTISFYKHNSRLLKKVGSFVEKGEAIAIIGNSGHLTTGPHLHFELWQDGQAVDPLAYFYLEKLNP